MAGERQKTERPEDGKRQAVNGKPENGSKKAEDKEA